MLATFNARSFIFPWFLLRLIPLHVHCFSIDENMIRFSITTWNKCVDHVLTPSFLEIYETSLSDCVSECVSRRKCAMLSFSRTKNTCRLFDDNASDLVTEEGCVTVRRNYTYTNYNCSCTPEQSCNFSTGACETYECPRLDLPNGEIKGNMKGIGAAVHVECNKGYHEANGVSSVTCSPTGNWSYVPQCVTPHAQCPVTWDWHERRSPTGHPEFEVQFSRSRTSSGPLADDECEAWFGSSNVRLVHIDEDYKMMFIMQFIQDCLDGQTYWISGSYDASSAIWEFEDDTPIETFYWPTNFQTPSAPGSCISVSETSPYWETNDCDQVNYVICEFLP